MTDKPTLTDADWKLAREMAREMWGADLDSVEWMRFTVGAKTGIVPMLGERVRPQWFVEDEHRSGFGHVFEQERIEIDRWLVPWRIRAGYSPRLNVVGWWEAGDLHVRFTESREAWRYVIQP